MFTRPPIWDWDKHPWAWETHIVRTVARRRQARRHRRCPVCLGMGYVVSLHLPRPGWPYWTPGRDGQPVRVPHKGFCKFCLSPELRQELDR